MITEYIDCRELMYQVKKVFDVQIDEYKREGNGFMVFKLLTLEINVIDRLEVADLAADEIIEREHKAADEGLEIESEIYAECAALILKKLGMKCYRIVNGVKEEI
ncbi:MAG: hypothetical protein J5625_04200 [Lachnospiraceae bacterium]|nr:hypothetical protein [Lachnospiraceae bacterium]